MTTEILDFKNEVTFSISPVSENSCMGEFPHHPMSWLLSYHISPRLRFSHFLQWKKVQNLPFDPHNFFCLESVVSSWNAMYFFMLFHVVTINKPKFVLTKRPGAVQSFGHWCSIDGRANFKHILRMTWSSPIRI